MLAVLSTSGWGTLLSGCYFFWVDCGGGGLKGGATKGTREHCSRDGPVSTKTNLPPCIPTKRWTWFFWKTELLFPFLSACGEGLRQGWGNRASLRHCVTTPRCRGTPALQGESPWTLREVPRLSCPSGPSRGPSENDQWKVTVFCLFGLLLPDVGLTDPEVSSSSAEDQEDKSYVGNRFS